MGSSRFRTFRQIERKTTQKHLLPNTTPISVRWGWGCPNEITMADGRVDAGTCLRCINSPCIKFSNEEIKLNQLSQFPINTLCDICPTDAIQWRYDGTSPFINEELCIGCGLCASRCPACAIYFKKDGVAALNDKANSIFALNTINDEEATERTIKLLQSINWSNPMIQETDNVLEVIYKKVSCFMGDEPNIMIRNILIALGLRAGIRRAGDTNIRMDIVFEEQGQVIKGIGEIEFGMDVLSTPRNTMDNVAVFMSRYRMTTVLPIVFPLTLPNQRSEYWQVIKDIKVVLKIPIRTATLGLLLLLLWNNVKLSMKIASNLYSDVDSFSTRSIAELAIGRKVRISEGFLGIIEPQK